MPGAGLDPADGLDLGPADRLVIGDDRQDLGRRAAQLADLLALAAQQVSEVRRGLELPAPPALDQAHAALPIVLFELAQR